MELVGQIVLGVVLANIVSDFAMAVYVTKMTKRAQRKHRAYIMASAPDSPVAPAHTPTDHGYR